jgi:hypothetical protein
MGWNGNMITQEKKIKLNLVQGSSLRIVDSSPGLCGFKGTLPCALIGLLSRKILNHQLQQRFEDTTGVPGGMRQSDYEGHVK